MLFDVADGQDGVRALTWNRPQRSSAATTRQMLESTSPFPPLLPEAGPRLLPFCVYGIPVAHDEKSCKSTCAGHGDPSVATIVFRSRPKQKL